MSNLANYDRNHQVDIIELILKKGSKSVDITPLMDQFIIFEDIFQTSLTARLIFRDQVNLVGTFPIVSGETISFKYRTPIYNEIVSLEMVVYKVGERGIGNNSENIQINQLFLCTPETWWAANNHISAAYKGTYTDIISKIINETGSKKKFIDKEDSVGIVEFVAPATFNVFQAVKFATGRSNTKTASPMFFWETPHGFHLRSLKEIYRETQRKNLYIEDRSIAGVDKDADKVFNTCFSFEYLESNDRLSQYNANAFGADNFTVDIPNARIFKMTNTYNDLFHKHDIKLNKYPLNDDSKSINNDIDYIPYRKDLSHNGTYNRRSTLALMDNLKLNVQIPGDSQFKVGDIVWLQIPAKVGLDIGVEEHSSGKWLARSIKHLITKTTYTMTCELTKDSFDKDVTGG